MVKGVKGFQKGNTSWESRKTHKHSELTKSKISEANKGCTPWNKGNRAYISECLYCGKIIKESSKRKYCSHKCCAKDLLLGTAGHLAWNKGMGLGKEYKSLRKRVNGKIKMVSHIVWEKNNPNSIIKSNEVIHHIDENPKNNTIENLKKMSRSKHIIFHHKINIAKHKSTN